MSSSHLSRRHPAHDVAMSEHFRNVEYAETAIMELTGPQAKAALMLLAREHPVEILEVLAEEL